MPIEYSVVLVPFQTGDGGQPSCYFIWPRIVRTEESPSRMPPVLVAGLLGFQVTERLVHAVKCRHEPLNRRLHGHRIMRHTQR